MAKSLRQRLFLIIFGTDTPAGKAFDVGLLIAILLSILAVMLESVPSLQQQYGAIFSITELILTVAFTLEYVTRIYVTERKRKYIFSFYGIIDLLSLLPTYLSLFFTGTQYLLIIRALRLLRVFRILKLGRFVGEGEQLGRALRASRHKITVFLGGVVTMVMIMGTVMYLVEGGENGFTSIPRSVYWAIVTLTTVGYGDIAPQTILGQAIASIVMIMGYAIIAVPTGIVTVELGKDRKKQEKRSCSSCGNSGHGNDALYCKYCGDQL
ncbi:MAG: ion transporter [Roseivirga sp.]|nr:ion transporter [Roseivirga sp.]